MGDRRITKNAGPTGRTARRGTNDTEANRGGASPGSTTSSQGTQDARRMTSTNNATAGTQRPSPPAGTAPALRPGTQQVLGASWTTSCLTSSTIFSNAGVNSTSVNHTCVGEGNSGDNRVTSTKGSRKHDATAWKVVRNVAKEEKKEKRPQSPHHSLTAFLQRREIAGPGAVDYARIAIPRRHGLYESMGALADYDIESLRGYKQNEISDLAAQLTKTMRPAWKHFRSLYQQSEELPDNTFLINLPCPILNILPNIITIEKDILDFFKIAGRIEGTHRLFKRVLDKKENLEYLFAANLYIALNDIYFDVINGVNKEILIHLLSTHQQANCQTKKSKFENILIDTIVYYYKTENLKDATRKMRLSALARWSDLLVADEGDDVGKCAIENAIKQKGELERWLRDRTSHEDLISMCNTVAYCYYFCHYSGLEAPANKEGSALSPNVLGTALLGLFGPSRFQLINAY